MTATVTPAVATESRPAAGSVVVALAAFEGRKMLTHPLLWIGGLASAGLAVFELIEEAPVLNRVSMTLAWTMAPLAASVALLSGWAVLRARARTDAQPPAVSPVAMHQRVTGILLGIAYPAAATFVVQMALLGWVMTQDPVTSVVWTELLVGPAYVLFAGVFAAALTRWLPHAATPLFALLGLAVIQAVVPYRPEQWGEQIGVTALAPIVWPQTIIPYEVSFRLSGLHLAYLAGLVVTFGAVAGFGKRLVIWSALVIGAASAVVFGAAQVGPVDESLREAAIGRLVGDQADLTCEAHREVTYCTMPGYEGWIDDWAGSVEPLVTIPPAVEPFEVRQYPVHNTFLLDGENYSNWWWIETAYEDFRQRDVVPVGSILADFTIRQELVGAVAHRLVGCQAEGLAYADCVGQSQNVVALWLQSDDPRIRENIEYNARPDDPRDSASVTECMVVQLLGRPDVQQLVTDNWEILTDPGTTYNQAAEILGVSVPSGYDENDRIQGGCT